MLFVQKLAIVSYLSMIISSVTGQSDVAVEDKMLKENNKILRQTEEIIQTIFPSVIASDFSEQKGIRAFDGGFGHFDNGDYIKYDKLDYGPSGTTKSMTFEYAKSNIGGHMEVRLGDENGILIGEFKPTRTGSWETYVTEYMNIKDVTGVHNVTFVGKGSWGVLNLRSFALTENIHLSLSTDYRVDDNDKGRDRQCTYKGLLDAYGDQVFSLNDDELSTTSVEDEFFAYLSVDSAPGAEVAVNEICKTTQEKVDQTSFDAITYDEGSQFVQLHYDGRGPWNEETETLLYPSDGETPVQVLKQDAAKVKTYYELSKHTQLEMPNLAQFDPSTCAAHVAQCCWPRDRQANDNNGNCATPYDKNCVDKDVADNTNLCYNELGKAPYSNEMDAAGFSIYDGDDNNGEGAIHCHGFAWSMDDLETTSRFKANALFFVSMYDHMHNRGYVDEIPGSPMCGCVEHMPIVTRSDCTQTDVKEQYTFLKGADNIISGKIDKIDLVYSSCQGANNQNNDLEAFVQQLVNDGKLSTAEQDIFKTRVVGKDQCEQKTSEYIKKSGYEAGYEIDESKWTYIVGEGFGEQDGVLNTRLFKEMFEAQDVQIVRRVCPSCRSNSHKDIYYRRFTPMPDDFDLLDTLMNNWFDKNNTLGVDFNLYSSYLDAYYDTKPWTYCNFNDRGIGFPRDCGPTGKVGHNWNAYWRTSGGYATQHAFLLPANPVFTSTMSNLALGKSSQQQGVHNGGVADRAVDGNTVGIFNWGSTSESSYQEDPYWLVELESNATIDKVYIWGCQSGCRHSLKDVRVDVYDTLYGDVIATKLIAGSGGVMNVVEFDAGTVGQVVRITRETSPGRKETLSLAEVQVEGTTGAAITDELYAEVEADEYSVQKGTYMTGGGKVVGSFDNGDFVTYESLNFGPSGTTKSIRLNYAKGNTNGIVLVMLGDEEGKVIGEFKPVYTGSWSTYIDAFINIKDVTGVHNVTFVGKGSSGVLNLRSFELTGRFHLSTYNEDFRH